MIKWTQTERFTCNLVRVSNRKINEFRTHLPNDDIHEVAKLLVFRELRALGHNLIVEAIFEKSGLRCDILDLTDATAIEVLFSEDKKKFESKSYPVRKIAVDALEVVSMALQGKLNTLMKKRKKCLK